MRRNSLQVVFLLLFLSGLASAQSGAVRGKVRLPSGATITGVIVELWHSSGLISQTVTTRDGDFEFPGLIPAQYEVAIKYQGYQPVLERVVFRYDPNIARMEIVNVEINLKAIVASASASPKPGTTFVQDVPPEARTAFQDGLVKLKDGKPIEGVTLLRQAISVFPNYFDAHLTLAGQLSKEGNSEEALKELESARRINDKDARVYHLFGILMGGQRKYITAEYAFRAAIERDPTSPASYLSHAIVLIELVRQEPDEKRRKELLAEADRDLTRALELSNEKLFAAYLQRARIREVMGDRKAAARDLETYLRLNPGDKNAPAIREAVDKLRQQPHGG